MAPATGCDLARPWEHASRIGPATAGEAMKSLRRSRKALFGALRGDRPLAALGEVTASAAIPHQRDTEPFDIMTLEQEVSWIGETRPTSIEALP